MGADDGACDGSANGEHQFVITELAPGGRGGLAQVSECLWCPAVSYTPSAGDDPRRLPL